MNLLNDFPLDIAKLFDNPIKILTDNKYDEKYFAWLNQLENSLFREELHYSQEEFISLFRNSNPLIFFIFELDIPKAIIFGYDYPNRVDCFYLDLIAVITQGRGIGKALLSWLSSTLRSMGYKTLRLDTEEKNDRGQLLLKYYEKVGFKLIQMSEKGSLLLELGLDHSEN